MDILSKMLKAAKAVTPSSSKWRSRTARCNAVTKDIEQRRSQQAFITRGLASRTKARRSGRYVPAEAVIRKLRGRLAKAKRSTAR